MPKRSRKPPQDEAQAAFKTVSRVLTASEPPKNPAAVALGRLGGIKGGPARAAKMSKRQRSLSARKAALARWKGAK